MSSAGITPVRLEGSDIDRLDQEVIQLNLLYISAVGRAQTALQWYESRHSSKKRGARFLRASALILGALTAIIPSVISLLPDQIYGIPSVRFNPVATITGIAATSAILFDKFYGFSAAWGRFVLASQTIERQLELFKIDWRKKLIHISQATSGSQEEILQAYDFLASFSEQLSHTLLEETEGWLKDFKEAIGDAGKPRPDEPQRSLGATARRT